MKPSFINSTQKRVVRVGNAATSISTVVFCFDNSVDCPSFLQFNPTVSNSAEVFETACTKTSAANTPSHSRSTRDTLLLISDAVAAGIYGGTAVPTEVAPEAPTETLPSLEQPAPETPITQRHPTTPHWSPAVQSTLDQPPASFPRRLILGGLCFISLAMVWAYIGQVEEIGHAKGQLIPKGEVFKVHPTTMGRVAVLTIDEGQPIEAGQIIAELETTFEANEIERLEDALTADQIQLAQRETLLERIELEERTNAEIAAANIRAHEAAIAQAEAHIRVSRQLHSQLQHDVAASEIRVERIKPSVEQGGISQEYFFSAEQTLRDRQQNLTQQQGEIERSTTEITQLQAELDQKRAEADKVQHEIQQQAQRLAVEITELEADITEKERLLARAEAELAQRFLYAPVDGTISSISVNNVGEVVQPGQTIAEIAPEGAPLVLSAFLPDKEAGFVEIGMPVQVKFDAYPFQDYGIISGQVTSIASDAIVDEKLGTVYRLEVTLERSHVEDDGKTIPFKAGQTADADIVIRKRRVIDILLDPIRKLKVSGIDL
ncbi:MAG: HlyD family type I secretion periplasmic adaptor subunit [Leptolyngbyaceae cyanobacterium]